MRQYSTEDPYSFPWEYMKWDINVDMHSFGRFIRQTTTRRCFDLDDFFE